MANETTIAAGTVVRGSIEGTGNLVVAGHVEGDVQLSGEVTVESTGLVGANVRAARIVVRGAVRGDLSADEAVVLEEGARVVGDVIVSVGGQKVESFDDLYNALDTKKAGDKVEVGILRDEKPMSLKADVIVLP